MSVRRLVAGNWKMNGSRALADSLVGTLAERMAEAKPACRVAVCPPAHLLDAAVAAAAQRVAVGAQDCSPEAGAGAFTGEIAAAMLAEAGCAYVIVGHSERRQRHGEDDALVRRKAESGSAAGLTPIVCVGETLEERSAGKALTVVTQQVRRSLPEGAGPVVVAYEPVWAIGTGRTATGDDIAQMHAAIAEELGARRDAVPLLYGGSVKAGNAGEILATPGVDGALVGGASLTLDDFWAIVEAA